MKEQEFAEWFRNMWNKGLDDFASPYINYTTAQSEQQAPLTLDVLKEAIRQLKETKAKDTRPYGPATVYVMNAATVSQIYEYLKPKPPFMATPIRYYIRERVRINGEMINVPYGQVLAVHEDMLAAVIDDPYYLPPKKETKHNEHKRE